MIPPPALRPPAWAEKYRWHWITPPQRDIAIPAMWDRSFWRMTNGINIDPFPAYAAGYRYSHPADPSARVIDPGNVPPDPRDAEIERLRGIVALLDEPNDSMLCAAREWSYAKYGKPIGNDAAIGCFSVMVNAARQTLGPDPTDK